MMFLIVENSRKNELRFGGSIHEFLHSDHLGTSIVSVPEAELFLTNNFPPSVFALISTQVHTPPKHTAPNVCTLYVFIYSKNVHWNVKKMLSVIKFVRFLQLSL